MIRSNSSGSQRCDGYPGRALRGMSSEPGTPLAPLPRVCAFSVGLCAASALSTL